MRDDGGNPAMQFMPIHLQQQFRQAGGVSGCQHVMQRKKRFLQTIRFALGATQGHGRFAIVMIEHFSEALCRWHEKSQIDGIEMA